MGVYIKGVEIPDVCGDCFCYDGDLWCNALYKRVAPRTKRTDEPDCPLVEVTDHGRLGDLDKLAKRIRAEGVNQAEQLANRRHPAVMAYADCWGKCKDAPTVIPADRKETDNAGNRD